MLNMTTVAKLHDDKLHLAPALCVMMSFVQLEAGALPVFVGAYR